MAHYDLNVATRNALVDAVNRANSQPEHTFTARLADRHYGRFQFTGPGQLLLAGADSVHGAVFGDYRYAVFQVWDAPNFRGATNIRIDGDEGNSKWGLVLGAAHTNDNKGPVTGAVFEDIDVGWVEQETVKISSSSANITIRRVDAHHTGMGGRWGEAFYIGQGGDLDDRPNRILLEDITATHVRNGEALDVKVGARNVTCRRFRFVDVAIPYSGALTVGIDNSNGGHNQSTNHVFEDGVISNVFRSGSYMAHRVQVGTDCTLRRVHVEDADGRAVDVVRQFGGPSKTVRLVDVTARDVRELLGANRASPHGGDSPGVIVGSVVEGDPVPWATNPTPDPSPGPEPVPVPCVPSLDDIPDLVEAYSPQDVISRALDGLGFDEAWTVIGESLDPT